jgi:hypothetical protein
MYNRYRNEGFMKNSIKLILVSGLTAAAVAANAQTVYSNNYDPGDYFTNAGGSAANQALTSPIGGTGDVATYRETKNGATVGINTTMARSGNGSAWFSAANVTGGKAEIAISKAFTAAGDSNGVLGSFDSLSSFGADLYTQSSSISNQATIVRMELFSATDGGVDGNGNPIGRYGQLVFDTSWAPSHFGSFTFGQWNTVNMFGNAGSTWLRATSGINTAYGSGMGVDGGERTLTDWMGQLGGKGYNVISVNAGVGTFDGSFEGGVDNLSVGFGGNNKTYNFEAVPEPTTVAAVGLGALAMIRRRRTAKK